VSVVSEIAGNNGIIVTSTFKTREVGAKVILAQARSENSPLEMFSN